MPVRQKNRYKDEQPVRNVGRQILALAINIDGFLHRHGFNQVGLLTLTFDHDLTFQQAQVHTNSVLTNVIRPRYGEAIVVREPTKRGRPHLHILVPLKTNIRTGCDFAELKAGRYRSAPWPLRDEWRFWRRTAAKYGFGKWFQLMPIEKNAEALTVYLSKGLKEVAPSIRCRRVSYIGHRATANSNLRKAGGRSAAFRRKTGAFVQMMADHRKIASPTDAEMVRAFGRRWAFVFRESIESFPLAGEYQPRPPLTDAEYADIKRQMQRLRKSYRLNGGAAPNW